jgi:hypothetical protein
MCLDHLCKISVKTERFKIAIMLSTERLVQYVVYFVKKPWSPRKVDPTSA